MDRDDLIANGNASLRGVNGAALKFAPGQGVEAVDVHIVDDDMRLLCTTSTYVLAAMIDGRVVGEFVQMLAGVSRREIETGKRMGMAMLRQRTQALLFETGEPDK